MSYVQPQRIVAYDKSVSDEPVLMSVPCKRGDAIAYNSSGYGILADATDETKLAVGFASREVTALDIAVSYTGFIASPSTVQKGSPEYDRGVVTLLDSFVARPHGDSAGTAQTPGARIYLATAGTVGATRTVTQTTTSGETVQELGEVSRDGLGELLNMDGCVFKYVTATASVMAF